MARKPILVSYTECSNWTTVAGSPVTASAITWQANDLIVVMHGAEGPATLGTPTGTGLSFTSLANNTAASSCATRLSVARPQAAGSSTVTATNSAGQSGLAVWVWRRSNGNATTAEQHTTTKTVSLTPRGGGTHSAICWAAFDFSATAPGAAVLTPTTGTTEEISATSGYTIYVAELADQSSGGAVSYGVSGGTSTGVFSILVCEVQGDSGWSNNYQGVSVGNGMSTGEKLR